MAVAMTLENFSEAIIENKPYLFDQIWLIRWMAVQYILCWKLLRGKVDVCIFF
jgi:hypothetical protein